MRVLWCSSIGSRVVGKHPGEIIYEEDRLPNRNGWVAPQAPDTRPVEAVSKSL